MFAKSVIESDVFLDMPTSSRLLYYDLGMQGDDDGFVASPRRVMRATGASDDDLILLVAKQFIFPFKSGVVVIRHWKVHNYIRSDRYTPTLNQAEKAMLSESSERVYLLESGAPLVYQPSTVGIPNGSIGEVREDKRRGDKRRGDKDTPDADASPPTPYSEIVELFNSICVSFPKVTRLSNAREKALKARLNHYALTDFKILFAAAEASSFLKGKNDRNWSANFDWLIKDSNMAKVLDGNYVDKGDGNNAKYGADRDTSAQPKYGTVL